MVGGHPALDTDKILRNEVQLEVTPIVAENSRLMPEGVKIKMAP
jgi:hypothetical protein